MTNRLGKTITSQFVCDCFSSDCTIYFLFLSIKIFLKYIIITQMPSKFTARRMAINWMQNN